jgi:hypothetical protein
VDGPCPCGLTGPAEVSTAPPAASPRAWW